MIHCNSYTSLIPTSFVVVVVVVDGDDDGGDDDDDDDADKWRVW